MLHCFFVPSLCELFSITKSNPNVQIIEWCIALKMIVIESDESLWNNYSKIKPNQIVLPWNEHEPSRCEQALEQMTAKVIKVGRRRSSKLFRPSFWPLKVKSLSLGGGRGHNVFWAMCWWSVKRQWISWGDEHQRQPPDEVVQRDMLEQFHDDSDGPERCIESGF